MPPTVAAFLGACFVLWLFRSDATGRVMPLTAEQRGPKRVSAAIWIPLVWGLIVASKPISLWLGLARRTGPDGGLEDILIDKLIFLALIGTATYVLSQRWGTCQNLVRQNRWVFAYFIYLAISVVWSYDPFVAFKRWFKDFGTVLMVLVVLSEKDPLAATRTLLARFAYLLVPLSVVLVKYYPHISRGYDTWTNRVIFVGITTNKNIFGMTLFVCGLSLFWLWLHARDEVTLSKDRYRAATLRYAILLASIAWLLLKSNCATATACTGLGAGMLLALRVPSVRRNVRYLGTYCAVGGLVAILLQSLGTWEFLVGSVAKSLGRDPTLHGRAEIWDAVLREDINPLTGAGFYSFWSPERMQRLSEKYFYLLNEAHNGYLETYLNSGLIGLGLLLILLGSVGMRIKQQLIKGDRFASFRLVFFLLVLLYGATEAVFNRLSLIWLILLLVMMAPPILIGSHRRNGGMSEETDPGNRIDEIPRTRTLGRVGAHAVSRRVPQTETASMQAKTSE